MKFSVCVIVSVPCSEILAICVHQMPLYRVHTGYLHVWLNAKQCNANYCNALDVVKAYHAKYMQHMYEMDGFQGLMH